MSRRRRHEVVDFRHGPYTAESVDGLFEGEIRIDLGGQKVRRVVPTWGELRSVVEQKGSVDSEAWCLVFDLELAVSRLAQKHPDAAAVIWLRLSLDYEKHHLDAAFGHKNRNWERLVRKGKAWLTRYLVGQRPGESPHDVMAECERAYERAH